MGFLRSIRRRNSLGHKVYSRESTVPLALEPLEPRLLLDGYSGGAGTEASPYQIGTVTDWQELIASPADWDNHFILTANLDFGGSALTPVAPDTKSYISGFQGTQFTGQLDGQGHVLKNFIINQPSRDYIGLFGTLGKFGTSGQVKNLSVENGTITGREYVGGLCGYNDEGAITSCYATGAVTGSGDYVGGLCGSNAMGAITSCYATGAVTGSDYIMGGLCGVNWGEITSCYATGAVTGSVQVGGLCGQNAGEITSCYATGAVTGSEEVGGLCGWNYATITSCYATGAVTGSGNYVGGLCALQGDDSSAKIENSFWDKQTTGRTTGYNLSSYHPGTINNVLGKTTAEMKTQSTFTAAGWDFSSTDVDPADWRMVANDYPHLAWEQTNNNSPQVTLVTPGANTSNSDTTPSFDWTGSDPENDTLSYILYIDDDSSPFTDPLLQINTATTSEYTLTAAQALSTSKDYWWGVSVNDSHNAAVKSESRKFTISETPPPPPQGHEVFEILARDIAYRDWTVNSVVTSILGQTLGYTVSQVFSDAVSGFYALGLASTVADPCLVIRGTQITELGDILADTDSNGIGYNQFIRNRSVVENWLKTITLNYAKPDIVGHSLGGALAQWFAADVTSSSNAVGKALTIDEVVTFNSPGIPEEQADKFVATKAGKVTHYIFNGDLVSLAGEKFIKGSYRLASASDISYYDFDKHRTPILVSQVGSKSRLADLTLSDSQPVDWLNDPWFWYKDIDYLRWLAGVEVVCQLVPALKPYEFLPAAMVFRWSLEAKRQEIGEKLSAFTAATHNSESSINISLGLPLPGGVIVESQISFVYRDINMVSFGLNNLNKPMGTTGVFLQKIAGQLDHFSSTDTTPITFGGQLGLTYGPEITINLPSWAGGKFEASLVELLVSGAIDINHLEASGDLKILGGLATGTANAELNWQKGYLEVDTHMEVLAGLISADALLRADTKGNFSAKGTGAIAVPDPIPVVGGMSLASGNVMIQYSNDSTFTNDYVAGWASFAIPLVGQKDYGFKVCFDGSYGLIGGNDISKLTKRSVQDNSLLLTRAADTSSRLASAAAEQSYQVGANTPYILLNATWSQANSNVPLQLVNPSGQIITEADFASLGNVAIVPDMTDATHKTIVVVNPAPGVWTLQVPQSSGLGNVELAGIKSTEKPAVTVSKAGYDSKNNHLTMHYSATDGDSNAVLMFYYDSDKTGYDGVPVSTAIVEKDGQDRYEIDLDIPLTSSGSIYAVIMDESNAPVYSNLVTITDPNQLPVISSLTVSPATITPGQSITITASNVTDADGQVSGVSFYRDVNKNGQYDSSDTLLGQGTKISNNWSLTTALPSSLSGTVQIIALASDNLSEISAPKVTTLSINQPPAIGSISASPASIYAGQTFTVSASNVTDADGQVNSVAFYRDVNKNGQYDSSDVLMGQGIKSSNNWSLTTTLPASLSGTVQLLALASDNQSGVSTPAVTTLQINPAENYYLVSKSSPMVFFDATNDRVQIKLNEGTARVYLDNNMTGGADIDRIELFDTTIKSTLSIATKGEVSVGSIITKNSDGNLKAINAPNVRLRDSLQISGGLNSLTINDILEGSRLTIGTSSVKPMVIKTDRIGVDSNNDGKFEPVQFSIAGDIKSFTASEFLSTPTVNSTVNLAANSLGSLAIKAGDLSASIKIGNTIGAITASGSISGQIMAQNTIRTITSKGAVDGIFRAQSISAINALSLNNAIISTRTNIGSINVKWDVIDTHVLAGYDIGVDFDNDTPVIGELVSGGQIKTFKFGGQFKNSYVNAGVMTEASFIRLYNASPSGADYSHSGGQIGSVVGNYIDTNNNGTPFGFFSSGIIRSINIDNVVADDFVVITNIPEKPLSGPDINWVYISDSGDGMKDEYGNSITNGGFTGEMSKYETTNAQYAQFLNAALATGDIIVSGSYVIGASGSNSGVDFADQYYYNLAGSGWTWNGAASGGAARISYNDGQFTVDGGFEDHPVTYVSWYGATAFCNYYGYRLPTEWEWQAVADFDGGYTYGCGITINTGIVNFYDSVHPNGTTTVGVLGAFGYGMADMAGNVWEWTSSLNDPALSYRVIRGGSWYYYDNYCAVSCGRNSTPFNWGPGLGFRVCRP